MGPGLPALPAPGGCCTDREGSRPAAGRLLTAARGATQGLPHLHPHSRLCCRGAGPPCWLPGAQLLSTDSQPGLRALESLARLKDPFPLRLYPVVPNIHVSEDCF